MAKMTWLERRYRRSRLDYVRHITIDPRGPGVVRIHMIPPRTEDPADPFLLLLNGAQLVPLNLSWAILLANFMDQLEPWSGREIGEQDWQSMLSAAVKATRRTYPGTGKAVLLGDLELMLRSIVAIARGQEPPAEVGALSLGEYAGRMSAPHRMDLMISAMTREGRWHCNQKCLHCYAAGQTLGETPELTTRQKHTRECFVVLEDGADPVKVEETIKNMPNYFADYDTTVHFISEEELKANHSGIPHGGFVIRSGKTGWNLENNHVIEYSLKLDSNPEFTSCVIVAYARAAYRLYKEGQSGCKTVFDIAPAYLSAKDGAELRKSLL